MLLMMNFIAISIGMIGQTSLSPVLLGQPDTSSIPSVSGHQALCNMPDAVGLSGTMIQPSSSGLVNSLGIG